MNLDKVSPEPNTGCWFWLGVLNSSGYGPHRKSYEEFRGPIPEGLTIDHKCHQRDCVNPEHLRAVTMGVNLSNKLSRYAGNVCKRGHALIDTDLDSHGQRFCRVCRNSYMLVYKREWRKRKRANTIV